VRLERVRRNEKTAREVSEVGVEERTLEYLVREEMQREKLKIRTGRRAWKFEERLIGGGVMNWRDCI